MDLICEGPCNPHVGSIDALVRAADLTDEGVMRPGMKQPAGRHGTPTLWRLQRKLVYTTHVQNERTDFAACLVCCTVRRFGNTI